MRKTRTPLNGLTFRVFARSRGLDHVTAWRWCKAVEGLAVRVDDPKITAGFRYLIVDPDRLEALMTGRLAHPRYRPPAGRLTPAAGVGHAFG